MGWELANYSLEQAKEAGELRLVLQLWLLCSPAQGSPDCAPDAAAAQVRGEGRAPALWSRLQDISTST